MMNNTKNAGAKITNPKPIGTAILVALPSEHRQRMNPQAGHTIRSKSQILLAAL
jgi:hypothetical protein